MRNAIYFLFHAIVCEMQILYTARQVVCVDERSLAIAMFNKFVCWYVYVVHLEKGLNKSINI